MLEAQSGETKAIQSNARHGHNIVCLFGMVGKGWSQSAKLDLNNCNSDIQVCCSD
jgi:hypothetical protein